MARIVAFTVHAIDLPFRLKFEHAAASRSQSESLFVELKLDDGTIGWGESLPRPYVTGEARDGACVLLSTHILPHLLDRSFASFDEVISFLTECDGKAPASWVSPQMPQGAAWCAVDLALLDAFGKHFKKPPLGPANPLRDLRYSGVVSSGKGWKHRAQLLGYRLLGFRDLKLKVDASTTANDVAKIHRMVGDRIHLRADVNMGWDVSQALNLMPALARHGIRSFEQPLTASDFGGAARLIRETGLEVMADESFSTTDSLKSLVKMRACTAVNARISKCGGLVATLARCREAHAAGLWVQIGCQVGESSLLSAAHLHLCAAFPEVRHAEGCFGKLLLDEDPASPALRFGRGGKPPRIPPGAGLGVEIDRACLERHRSGRWSGDS
jgi:L-alanine-DL-glutamate epimerase-like enolase superfamily enzyme